MHLKHVMLETAHLGAQRRFYGDTLALPVVDATDSGFTVVCGASRLRWTAAQPGVTPVHHVALNITPSTFESALAWVRARVNLLPFKGQDFIDFRASSWAARSLYFLDAGGHVMELIARERLAQPGDPTAFDSSCVMAVSEIGLASADQPTLVAALTAAGVPTFDGGPGRFAALGNDHGLLICVETGRDWLPTDNRQSGVYAVAARVSGLDAPLDLPGHPYRIDPV